MPVERVAGRLSYALLCDVQKPVESGWSSAVRASFAGPGGGQLETRMNFSMYHRQIPINGIGDLTKEFLAFLNSPFCESFVARGIRLNAFSNSASRACFLSRAS